MANKDVIRIHACSAIAVGAGVAMSPDQIALESQDWKGLSGLHPVRDFDNVRINVGMSSGLVIQSANVQLYEMVSLSHAGK